MPVHLHSLLLAYLDYDKYINFAPPIRNTTKNFAPPKIFKINDLEVTKNRKETTKNEKEVYFHDR